MAARSPTMTMVGGVGVDAASGEPAKVVGADLFERGDRTAAVRRAASCRARSPRTWRRRRRPWDSPSPPASSRVARALACSSVGDGALAQDLDSSFSTLRTAGRGSTRQTPRPAPRSCPVWRRKAKLEACAVRVAVLFTQVEVEPAREAAAQDGVQHRQARTSGARRLTPGRHQAHHALRRPRSIHITRRGRGRGKGGGRAPAGNRRPASRTPPPGAGSVALVEVARHHQ